MVVIDVVKLQASEALLAPAGFALTPEVAAICIPAATAGDSVAAKLKCF